MGNKTAKGDGGGGGGAAGGARGARFDLKSIVPDPVKGAQLKNVPLLAKFTDEERNILGGVLETRRYKDKEVVIRQGDLGHGFFIVAEGHCFVSRASEGKKEEVIGELRKGDHFGEAALINDSRRGATVMADGDVVCFYLDREAFTELFAPERLKVQFAKRTAISAEIVDHNKRLSTVAPVNAVKDKTPTQRKNILAAVKGNLLFEGLTLDHKNLIIDQMWRIEVKEGTSIIEQGDKGDNLYVVEEGSFDIFVRADRQSPPRKVAVRGKGTCFGELALMYNAPRAATVIASKDSVVWAVDRFTFRRILANVSDTQLHEYEQFLAKVDLLAPLSSRERAKIAEALEEVGFGKGETIMKQGDPGDCMYILREGDVSCTIEGTEVKRYKPGEYFGERALLKDEPRAATLTCLSDVVALRLDRAAFSLLLGPLEEIMQKRVESYRSPSEQKLAVGDDQGSFSVGGAAAAAAAAPVQTVKMLSIKREELSTIGTLGKGSFGHVQLVKDPKTNKTFALKAVNKAQIVQTGQQGHIMSEKRVMAQLEHPFLIRLYATYKDKDRLYFLLEPALGGELFSVLRARTFFDEDTARFYAASVVLAFEYMHSKNIIYRDLKPENLLLDSDGYLKVTDFGFAKVVTGRTYTLCGTPDYLAPEIVAGKGHGKGVDWWTLGILIYEMLSSYPPFYDEDPMKTYAKIMHGKITFPSHFSKDAVNLISRLLNHKATKRLGVVKGGATLIKEHPWFSTFDWKALIERRLKAPIIPKIASPEDISNFDDYPDDDEIPPYVDNGTDWDADF
jgi:CRP-like cAMP-binding protein